MPLWACWVNVIDHSTLMKWPVLCMTLPKCRMTPESVWFSCSWSDTLLFIVTWLLTFLHIHGFKPSETFLPDSTPYTPFELAGISQLSSGVPVRISIRSDWQDGLSWRNWCSLWEWCCCFKRREYVTSDLKIWYQLTFLTGSDWNYQTRMCIESCPSRSLHIKRNWDFGTPLQIRWYCASSGKFDRKLRMLIESVHCNNGDLNCPCSRFDLFVIWVAKTSSYRGHSSSN